MAREVIPTRWSEPERREVAKGAAGLGITFSAFVRQAGLVAAHRLAETRRPRPLRETPPKPSPNAAPEPAQRHIVTTSGSFDEYRRRDSLTHAGGEFRVEFCQE